MALEGTPTHPPARSRLEQLPLHQLIDICEWLVEYEPTTKSSLCAFALASRTCCSATDPLRFRQMNLFIRGPRKLHRDIQRWREALEAGDRMGFVRVMKITGSSLSSEGEERETKAGRDPEQLRRLMQRRRRPGLQDGEEDDEEKPKLLSGMDNPPIAEASSGRPSTQWPDEEPWQPLVDLCKELPILQDVVFASLDQFPRLLLSALHDNHLQVRLHMHHFGLRSLIHAELDQQAVHPDDIALATSPCLYSIVAVTSQYRDYQVVDYNEEAIMEMAGGLAPRLKNVFITQAVIRARNTPMRTIPRPPWQGFPSSLVDPDRKKFSKGHLKNLILGTSIGGDKLLEWSRRTDFSQLHSLALRYGAGISAVTQLAQISRDTPLAALSSLRINAVSHYAAGESDSDVDSAVAELLWSLCPLEELTIYGPVREQSFDAITGHHAEKLRKLDFHGMEMERVAPFALSSIRASQLSRRCLQLEELELQVARTQGDEEEVAVYRCLGGLPRLKRLTLWLYCCIKTIASLDEEDEEDDEDEREDALFTISDINLNGYATIPILQDAYRDSALDSNLALSIFRLVSRNNDLCVLKLRPYGFHRWCPMGNWLRWLARKWMIRKDAEGHVNIRELDVDDRQQSLEELQEEGVYAEWRRCKKAWDAVWPPRSQPWWDEWSSVPLKEDCETQE